MPPLSTQPERDQGRESDVQFTVHEYRSSGSQPRASQDNILRQGYQIVRDATSRSSRWKSVELIPTTAEVEIRKGYVLNKIPPNIRATRDVLQELKEWGAAVTEDEVYTLDELEEFNTSDVRHVILKETSEEKTPTGASLSSSGVPEKRAREGSSSAEREKKKRKLRADSLFRVIPQPHLHPTLFEPKARTFKNAFKKPRPTFIAPYTMDTFPNDTRLGWLIPVRGSFPWENENCTSGVTLDSTADILSNSSPVPGASEAGVRSLDCIEWTEDTLVKFWEYLLELRNKGKLGRLAISFHPARDSDAKRVAEASRSGLGSDASKLTIGQTVTGAPFKFSTIDYFKVYHDARNALYVRKALDLFQYQYTHEDGRIEKIRMLKGARFALVDEVSQGVLVV